LALQIGAEARAPAEHVVEQMVGDEGAAALLDAHQPLLGERANGAAHGMAIDVEARGKLRLCRQPAARKSAGGDLAGKALGDLPPAGNALVGPEHAHSSSWPRESALQPPADAAFLAQIHLD